MRKLLNEELGRPTLEECATQDKLPVVIVLDNVRSAQNVGSFFRTADAFGIGRIALCGISATPPNREIHKTALGAEQSVEWSYHPTTLECIESLRQEGYRIIAIEQIEGATMLNNFRAESTERYALVFGNEVDGVDQAVADIVDGAIEIPQVGIKHSLNVSVSAGILMWELFRQMR
ncbi:MAG: RNA methyltransferase [Alistipes sp.]|nr:RNA methyltransferase [Rikenellaceae bacterium]MBQ3233878.1 RNA methyltransferase [Alistipes sp.]MBQ5829490.1 RNA methyltransferase [Alistipes sp.]MBR2435898.1 RNA methyltransferase [Alistipes sp.]